MIRTPEGTVYGEAAPVARMPDPADEEEAYSRVLHLARIYLIMSAGLLISAAFSLVFGAGEVAHESVSFGARLAWNQLLFLAEVLIVPFIADKVPKIPSGVAAALFVSYAILNGLTFPGLFFWIAPQNLARLFAGTAMAYGILAFLYWKRRAELQGFSGILVMLAVGLVPAALVSIGAPQLARSTCLATVPAFLAVAFYYDHELSQPYQSFEDDDRGWKGSLAGAFFLYFAFVNLILVIQYTVSRFFADDSEKEE